MGPKRPFFGLGALKYNPELIPLLIIVTTMSCGGISLGIYAAATKPDVRIDRTKTIAPHEEVKPNESRKLLTVEQEYKAIPELEKLKKEIGYYGQ